MSWLNNLGITVKMSGLPSWSAYEQSRDTMYGIGFIGKAWACVIRPLFFPSVQRIAEWEFDIARAVLQAELMLAVIEAGTEKATEGTMLCGHPVSSIRGSGCNWYCKDCEGDVL